MRSVQATASVQKVRVASPQASPRLDLLIISIGEDDTDMVSDANKVCEECQLGSKTLRLDQQPGQSMADKTESLMKTLRSMRQQGQVDRATQILIVGHGFKSDGNLALSDLGGKFKVDAVEFTSALRASLATGPGQDWDGILHLPACGGGILRKQFQNSRGHTLMYSGRKSAQSEDASATFGAVLRTLSKHPRSPDADNTELARKLWECAQEHSGENIAWCAQGAIHTHNALDASLEANASQDKRMRVLYAKLLHGDVRTVRRVIGNNARQMLASHRQADYLPLAAAARSKRQGPEKIQVLLALGENINQRDSNGDTALRHAAEEGNRATLEKLLTHGANPWSRDVADVPPWQIAKPACIDLLTADPAGAGAAAPTPLDAAAFPLHAACAAGRLPSSGALTTGAQVLGTKDNQGNTLLGVALLHGHLKLAARLLALGASPDARLGNGETLLGHAVQQGQTDAVRLLLKYGAKSKRSERNGMPLLLRALHAVQAGRASVALIDDVLKTNAGKQALKRELPLHYACLLGDPQLAIKLLTSGADLFQKDGRNRTAVQWVHDRMKEDLSWDTAEMRQALLDSLPPV